MDALRLGLSGLAGSEGCLAVTDDAPYGVCMAMGLEVAEEHDDEWLDYIETRKISKAFNFAVEQSMHCYIDGSAQSGTTWCQFFLADGQRGLVDLLDDLAEGCELCEVQGIVPT